MTYRTAVAAALLAAVSACGSKDPAGFAPYDVPTTPTQPFVGKDAGAPPSAPAAGGGSSRFDADAGVTADGGPTVLAAPSEVYGNSADSLYRLDPDTKETLLVGKFDGCTAITDIALDKDSHLFGSSDTALWSIDRKNAKCTLIAKGAYPNSLSFVPAGTLDPLTEVLVGYVGGSYFRIDTKTGEKANVGAIGGGLVSSGDIVSAIGGATFLTVKGGDCNDCLIEVNPATGELLKNLGSVSHADVFGLAFWAGKVYGFDSAGELFEVSFGGSALATASIDIPKAPANLHFWGAGSTTSAPVAPR